MIYQICYCGELLQKIADNTKEHIQRMYSKIFIKDIDYRKFTHYRKVNNLDDNMIQNLLNLSNDYQEQHDIQDMCVTNSILFKQILDKLNYNYKVSCGIWIMKLDCKEFLISHIVLYDKETNIIIDPSWWANRNINYFDGYFTFRINQAINEAESKKKIECRYDMYNTFFNLFEDTFLEPYELDTDKQKYYNDLLNYLQEKSGYRFLDGI
tara:strand:+ start:2951 stop:3580 length:630 start_codon:yes stop_codon:yes gene_type:complete